MSIPKKLFSDATGEAFHHCSVCAQDLENQLYFIEKAYHRNLGDQFHTTIFEYAICESCKRDMMKKVSQESLMKMQSFMEEHQNEMQEMMHLPKDLEHCSFSHKPVEEMDEYHVIAAVRNGETQFPPVVFGPEMLESYQELLSEKTKEAFDDFNDDFIDIPPELQRILNKDVKPVLI